MKPFFFPVAAMVCTAVCHAEITETQVRDGLPNVLKKLSAGGKVRVAYLGGSITEAAGWRVLSRQWLQKQYPQAEIAEINATFSGTTSAFGAFRVGREVLAERPDLLFVEFAVNDGEKDPQRTRHAMESIVRQTWTASPTTDICFIYTISKSSLPLYQSGRMPVAVENMEKVAAHYGVTSINFGPSVAELEKSGKLIFTAPLPAPGKTDAPHEEKILFSGDGVHPHPETGHPLYLAAIQRAWKSISTVTEGTAHALPAALDAATWQPAALIPMKDLKRHGDWRELPADSPVMKSAGSRTPVMSVGEKAGSTIEFSFTGTCFGLYSLKGPDAGNFRVTVDSLPPVEDAKIDAFCVAGRWRVSPWIYPQDLENGVHHVRIEMTGTSPDKGAILKENISHLPQEQRDGTRLYLSDVMVIGKPSR